MTQRTKGLVAWARARPEALALCLFLAACFALPTEAAFSLVFYVLVVPATLLGRPSRPAWQAGALILWSALTLLWGEGDAHRVWAFGLGAACTLLFVVALQTNLTDCAMRRGIGSLLICAGTLNAIWSIARGLMLHTINPQLLGWGITHHPILGASVMAGGMLTALIRAVSERPLRWPHAGAFAVMAAFILLTESRGPLLAASLGALLIGIGGPWRRWTFFVVLALRAVLNHEPVGWRQHQVSVLTDRGTHYRLQAWARTWDLIRERPLFGHGLAANLDLPGITFPHDLYLGVLFYSGAIGFALFAALVATVTLRLFRATSGPEQTWLAALWVNALVSGITDLGQITKGPGALWLIFWLPVGLILAYPTRMSDDPWSDSHATAAVRWGDRASARAQNSRPWLR